MIREDYRSFNLIFLQFREHSEPFRAFLRIALALPLLTGKISGTIRRFFAMI